MLMALGRGLGSIAVYGTEHPSVKTIVSQTYDMLQEALKSGNVTIGSFNGGLTVDEVPVEVSDIPIRTLEKRLVAMKVSHLVLHAGLSQEELQHLLSALCESTAEKKVELTENPGGAAGGQE